MAYRYRLTRDVAPLTGVGTCVWVMLNPSTATDRDDDPTIRRCIRFARDWGHARMVVVNLYGARATDPADLATHPDPIGPGNVHAITDAVLPLDIGDRIVCAWGSNAPTDHADQVLTQVRRLARPEVPVEALVVNADGTPRHPLYVPADTIPTPYPQRA